MSESVILLEDFHTKMLLEEAWGKVFAVSNKIIDQARKYGFGGMEIIPNPNIHDLLIVIDLMDGMLNSIYHSGLLDDYEQQRACLNAITQISKMETVALALKNNDEATFKEAIQDLERQAVL